MLRGCRPSSRTSTGQSVSSESKQHNQQTTTTTIISMSCDKVVPNLGSICKRSERQKKAIEPYGCWSHMNLQRLMSCWDVAFPPPCRNRHNTAKCMSTCISITWHPICGFSAVFMPRTEWTSRLLFMRRPVKQFVCMIGKVDMNL